MKFGTKMKLLWRILYKITTIYNDATASDVDCNQKSGCTSLCYDQICDKIVLKNVVM